MQGTTKRELSVINKSEIIIVLVVVGTRNIANTIDCGHKQSETKCSEINMRQIGVNYSKHEGGLVSFTSLSVATLYSNSHLERRLSES